MAPIPSVPPTFQVASQLAPQSVTFAIPSGTYGLPGTCWSITGEINSLSPTPLAIETGAAHNLLNFGSLPSLGFFSVQNLAVTAAQLADINTAAGGLLNAIMKWVGSSAVQGASVLSLTLTLVGVSTGGSPVAYSFVVTGANGCDPIIGVQMLDSSGNAANAPAGGQVFAFSDVANGAFLPSYLLFIPQGSSTGGATYSNDEQGTFPVTGTPGTGPLAGLPAQTVQVTVTCSSTEPNSCLNGPTRPYFRDAVRRKCGIIPPVDAGVGAPGMQPLGLIYPDNPTLNQCLGDALRTIGRRTGWHMETGLIMNVPVAPSGFQGIFYLPLQGVGGGTNQNFINSVRRAVFTDSQGNITRLLPFYYAEADRNRYTFDTVGASTPINFVVEGYSLGLYPAPTLAGTLALYADTASVGLCDDSSYLDQMPQDYQQVIEDLAVTFVIGYMPTQPRPSLPGLAARLPFWKDMADRGVDEILKMMNRQNDEYQSTIGAIVGRRRRTH